MLQPPRPPPIPAMPVLAPPPARLGRTPALGPPCMPPSLGPSPAPSPHWVPPHADPVRRRCTAAPAVGHIPRPPTIALDASGAPGGLDRPRPPTVATTRFRRRGLPRRAAAAGTALTPAPLARAVDAAGRGGSRPRHPPNVSRPTLARVTVCVRARHGRMFAGCGMPHPPAGPLSALGRHLVGAALATRPGSSRHDVAMVIRGARLRRGGGELWGAQGTEGPFGLRPFEVAGETVGHPEGTARDAGDSSRRGGQFATRGIVRDGAAAAAAAGHGGRAVCGRRRASAAVAGVVAGACQQRSSRGGGGSLPRRASTAVDGFRLDAAKHMAAPLHYALALASVGGVRTFALRPAGQRRG